MYPLRVRSLWMVLALIAVGCGDGGDGGGGSAGEGGKQPPGSECAGLQLDARKALPLEQIAIQGIPEAFGEELAARVRAGGEEALTLVFREEEGEAVLIAPLHPQGLVEGGPVELQLMDAEGRSCPPLAFEILAMAPAPGAAEESLQLLEQLLGTQLEFFGTSLEELRGSEPEKLPVELLPLFVAQDALFDPANPDSFAAILAGTAPALGGEEPDWELIDALLEHAGLPALLRASLQEWEELEAELPPEVLPLRQGGDDQLRQGAKIGGPHTAVDLDRDMRIAAWGKGYGPETATGSYLRDLALGVSVVGLLPGAGMGAAVTGAALFAFI